MFIRPDSGEFIRESGCTCAKLFVDEESTWHKSNSGIEQNVLLKKEYVKNCDAILLLKYDSAEKKY
jgi:hypothetical protein